MRFLRPFFLAIGFWVLMACLLVPSAPAHANTTPAPLGSQPRLARDAFVHLTGTPPGSFPFQAAQSSDGKVVVHFYQRDASFGSQLITQAQGYLQHPIADTLGFTLLRPTNIYIYNTRADFLKGAAIDNPAEVGAYTLNNTIYMPVETPADIDFYLAHELTHVVFHQNEVGNPFEDVIRYFPLWLDEGLATTDESDSAASDLTQPLATAIASGHPFDFLKSFAFEYPTNVTLNDQGYAESRSFITFLIATYGHQRFHQFLNALKTESLVFAGEQTFGLDWQMLQSHWEVSLGLHPTLSQQGYLPAPVKLVPLPTIDTHVSPAHVSIPPVPLPAWMNFVAILALGYWVWLCNGVLQRRQQTRRTPALVTAAPSMHLYADQHEAFPSQVNAMAAVLHEIDSTAAMAWKRLQPRWYDDVLACASVPMVVLAGVIGIWLDPAHATAAGVMASVLTAALFAVAALSLLISQPRRINSARLVMFALASMLVLGLFAVGPMQTAQSQAYLARGAYAQAASYLHRINAPTAQQAKVYRTWAQVAQNTGDDATAITAWRAAIVDDAPAAAASDCTNWLAAVTQWNITLINAHQFTTASQMLVDQNRFTSCTQQSAIGELLGADHLAWGNDALLSGDVTTALAQYHLVTQNYGQTKAASQASVALTEVPAQQLLLQDVAGATTSNDDALNAKLRALILKDPHTAAAQVAAETPETITGILADPARINNGHIYFFGFASRAQAIAFGNASGATDTSLVKFGGPYVPDGSFSVHVAPGYWYLPVWSEQSKTDFFFFPFDFASAVFTVQPLTPADIGTVG
jgi:hypothetical protein